MPALLYWAGYSQHLATGTTVAVMLPAHYLEVVLLRDFEELTIAEIAKRLNEQQGAIKSRLHRARELVWEYVLGSDMVTEKSH